MTNSLVGTNRLPLYSEINHEDPTTLSIKFPTPTSRHSWSPPELDIVARPLYRKLLSKKIKYKKEPKEIFFFIYFFELAYRVSFVPSLIRIRIGFRYLISILMPEAVGEGLVGDISDLNHLKSILIHHFPFFLFKLNQLNEAYMQNLIKFYCAVLFKSKDCEHAKMNILAKNIYFGTP